MVNDIKLINVDMEKSKNTHKGKPKVDKQKLKEQVKEFGYDSLCLRYKIAREAQMEYEKYKARRNGNLNEEERAESRCQRDCIAFFQTAYDIIGLNREN